MTIRGSGPRLTQSNPSLRDAKKRRDRILDAAERNSVIEGLPKFTPSQKRGLLRRLRRIA